MIPNTGVQAFNAVMRNANRSEEGRQIKGRLKRLSPSAIDSVTQRLNGKDVESVPWGASDTPYCALAALRRAWITKEQFATACCFCAVKQHPSASPWEEVALFHRDGVTPTRKAGRFIRSNLRDLPGVNRAKVVRFFALMQSKPYSEKFFYVIPEREIASHTDLYGRIVQVGAGVFGPCKGKRRMIPSVGMMQALLEAMHGASAVTLAPVIGVSSEKDIRKNGLEHTRDLALWLPDHPLPCEADGLAASQAFDFSYHDFYHAIIASGILPQHRIAIIYLADLLGQVGKRDKNPRMQAFFQTLQAHLIDMEYALSGEDGSALGDGLRLWKQVAKDAAYAQRQAKLREAERRRTQGYTNARTLPGILEGRAQSAMTLPHKLQHILGHKHSCAFQTLFRKGLAQTRAPIR